MLMGSVLLMLGIALLVCSQFAIALYAFTGNPFKGVLCLVIPGYIFVYAQKNKVGVWLMRGWYAGIALLVVGGVLAS